MQQERQIYTRQLPVSLQAHKAAAERNKQRLYVSFENPPISCLC